MNVLGNSDKVTPHPCSHKRVSKEFMYINIYIYFIRLFETSSRKLIFYWPKLSTFYTNHVFRGSIFYKQRD